MLLPLILKRMKYLHTNQHRALFSPFLRSRNVQAAAMVLRPGQSSSERKENEHPRAEQWLFVIRGRGRAKVGSRSVDIQAGSLLLIEKGERHQITCTGQTPLRTINFYCPPAYDDEGEVLPSAQGQK